MTPLPVLSPELCKDSGCSVVGLESAFVADATATQSLVVVTGTTDADDVVDDGEFSELIVSSWPDRDDNLFVTENKFVQ